jgi:molybdopterin converting factor subunit 1
VLPSVRYDDGVRIRLLAFATASQALGAAESTLELSDGSTVGDLRRALAARSPELDRRLPTLAVAVDGELASDARPLADRSEVALLPPVSGG